MKKQFALLIALSALAVVASADDCRTESNGRMFQDSSRDRSAQQCASDRSTNNFDCQQNARCLGDDGSRGFDNRDPRGQQDSRIPQDPRASQDPRGQQFPRPDQGGSFGQQGPPNQGGPFGHQPPGPPHGFPQGPWQPPGPPDQGGPFGHQPPPPPWQQNYAPNGSYRRSCTNIQMYGSVLSAQCRTRRGRYVYSKLDLRECSPRSDIGNFGGQLDCAQ